MHSIPQLPCCTRASQYWTYQTPNNSDLQWQYILIWLNHFKTRCAIIETYCNFQNVSLTLMMQIWNTNSSRCFQHILNFIISYFKVTFILCWTVSAVLKFFLAICVRCKLFLIQKDQIKRGSLSLWKISVDKFLNI